MTGREKVGEERMAEQVDLPVAMEPVRPMRSMVDRTDVGDTGMN